MLLCYHLCGATARTQCSGIQNGQQVASHAKYGTSQPNSFGLHSASFRRIVHKTEVIRDFDIGHIMCVRPQRLLSGRILLNKGKRSFTTKYILPWSCHCSIHRSMRNLAYRECLHTWDVYQLHQDQRERHFHARWTESPSCNRSI